MKALLVMWIVVVLGEIDKTVQDINILPYITNPLVTFLLIEALLIRQGVTLSSH